MVSLFSVGVLVLFCLGVSFGQRKLSRNVPVGADVKATVNFDCPEEFGYYPHPSDCTQYYVCVFGGALLESCTGGLMYSHELQTCDWPRNVGCDGLEVSGPLPAAASTTSSGRGRDREREREREEPTRTRYSPPPPPSQPAAVVTSRGQPRQLQHTQQEIIKQQQQQQLYAEAEETLPPAEEIENDRQQRVYRGQPSTVGQVQRDRDGLRHSNAIPTYSGRGDKIGVISFGTQNQHYSGVTDIDDLLTNDLTLKRRRKRQVHRSRPREEANSWHGGRRSNRNTFTRLNTSPLLPPPTHNQNGYFKPSYPQTRATEDFQPFVPHYIQAPSNTNSQNYQPISAPTNTDNNYAYFTLDKTNSPIKTSDQIRQIIDFHYNDDNPSLALEPAHSNMQPQNQSDTKPTLNETRKSSSKQITEAVTSGYKKYVKNTPEKVRSDGGNAEESNKEETSDAKAQDDVDEEEEEEHFNPPPEFFRTESRYENIRNPFADPEFDFDRFLDRLRGTTTPRPKVKVINKSLQGTSKVNASNKVSKTAKPVLAANLRTPVPFQNSQSTTQSNGSPGEYSDTSNAKTVLKTSDVTNPPPESPTTPNGYYEKSIIKPALYLNAETNQFGKTTVTSRPTGNEYYERSTAKPLHISSHESSDYYKSPVILKPVITSQYYEISTAKPTLFLNHDLNKNLHKSSTKLDEYYEKSTVKPVPFINSGVYHVDKTTAKSKPRVHEYYEVTTVNPTLVNNNQGSHSYVPRLVVNEYYERSTLRPLPVFNYKISDFDVTTDKSKPQVNEYYQKDTVKPISVLNYKNSDFDATTVKSRPSLDEYYEKSTVKPTPLINYKIRGFDETTVRSKPSEDEYYEKSTVNTLNREPSDLYKAAIISRPVTNDYYEKSTIKPFLFVNSKRTELNQTTVKSVPSVNKYYGHSTTKPSVNHEVNAFYGAPAKSRPTTTDYYEKTTFKPIVILNEDKRDFDESTDSSPKVKQYYQQPTEKNRAVHYDASDSIKTRVKSTPVVSEYYEKSTVKPARFATSVTTVKTLTSSIVNPTLAKATIKYRTPLHEKQNRDETAETPKKLYSSQIKSSSNRETKTTPKKPVSDYEYYYDDDEDYNSSKNNKKKEKSTNKNYYYYDDHYGQPKAARNGSKSGEVKYSAKYQEKPRVEKTKINRSSSTTTTPSPPTSTKKTLDSHSSQSIYTSTTPNSVHTARQRKRPTARPHITTTTTTMKPTRGKPKQRLTTQRYDLDTKREQSKVYISSEESSVAPAQPSIATATATARTQYNNSQYNNHYDPYYALYDDDVELYRDVDYSQHNNYNSAQRTPTPSYRGTPAPAVQSTSSREEPPKRGNSVYLQNNYSPQDIYQQSTGSDYADDNRYDAQVDDQTPYRQPSRQPPRGDRNELNDVEEAITKRTTTTTTRKPTTTTTRTTTTTTTIPRTIPSKKSTAPPASRTPVTAKENQTQAQSIINTIPEDPGHTLDVSVSLPLVQNPSNNSGIRHDITTTLPVTYRPKYPDTNSDFSLHESSFHEAVIKKPAPFALPSQITTEKPAFHYITKPPKSTDHVSSTVSLDGMDETINISKSNNPINQHKTTTPHRSRSIVPTTYSPPKFFLKSILPKPISHTTPVFSFRTANKSDARTYSSGDNIINPDNSQSKSYKTLKAVRKLINPITVNHELSTSTGATYESAEKLVSSINFDDSAVNAESLDYKTPTPIKSTYIDPNTEDTRILPTTIRFYSRPPTTATKATTTKTSSPAKYTTTSKVTKSFNIISTSTTPKKHYLNDDYIRDRLQSRFETEKLRNYVEPDQNNYTVPVKKRFRTTVEIPPAHELLDSDDIQKPEPDQPPAYKPKPFPKTLLPAATTTDVPQNTSAPTRVSRVNAAIKSLIANGGTRRPNTKCNENQSPNSKCNNDAKQRTSSRGRGSAHYASSGAQITNNEVTVNTNRGTPAPRSRPTLKPSTSIVSKAQEFIDIYKFPPRRPDPIYPQPQPDKTAAKCRKDVCLLPDCSCGGKEIPGDLPVEQVPQIVLITYDDSVNDLNKGLYMDLFEKGRTNPNGCPIAATFYVSHEWTDYSQVQNLYSDGHEIASHTVSHSFGEQFSQKKWTREVAGQREILSAYGGVHLEDVRGMRAPFLSVGGNKMFKMLYDSNFTYDSSMPIYENKPPSWPYTLDYKLFHDCMIPPCPTRSYPGVWEVPMVMWQDLNGGRCSMGDACSNPPDADGVFKMLTKNFQRHYTTNRAPFGLFYHAAWFTQPHHKEGFINFIDSILAMKDVWLLTNWQALQWVRDPTPTSRLNSFQPFQCDFSDRPKRCNNPKVCNLWHKSGVRYMRTCQPCPETYPWTGNTGIRSSRIDNDIED